MLLSLVLVFSLDYYLLGCRSSGRFAGKDIIQRCQSEARFISTLDYQTPMHLLISLSCQVYLTHSQTVCFLMLGWAEPTQLLLFVC
jgi:hypothetical protein